MNDQVTENAITRRKDVEAIEAIVEQLSEVIKKTYTYQSEWQRTGYVLKRICTSLMSTRGELRELRDEIIMDLEQFPSEEKP